MAVGWHFDNSYASLPEVFFSRLNPTPVVAPEMVVFNDGLAADLGLNADTLRSHVGIAILAGNQVPKGADPLALAYAGHQFGYSTLLGDGRAILLGEHITPANERFDIQLKGSGRTPYSRGGDGRATLGPMLREYIISEAMHALGIPTTRSLAVVTTGEDVAREILLPGAVLTRVAASHLRVGTFQYAIAWGAREDIKVLADYALRRHYPSIDRQSPDRFLQLLKGVVERQAKLVAEWQLVGFIHGVMNTDNMSISGETIDYGPCAFMDVFDPTTVFSSIDQYGRYAYGNQPSMAAWNLARFAETMLSLLSNDAQKATEMAQEAVSAFSETFQQHWLAGMRSKLGICGEEKEDTNLIEELLGLMQRHMADYTNTFRALTLNGQEELPMYGTCEWTAWYERWQYRVNRQSPSAFNYQQLMRQTNPAVIPRNHRVEEALSAAVEEGDLSVMERFLAILATPFAYTVEQEAYSTPPASALPYRTFCGT
jgi:uncharacterized protein YdiU (UPF0061 family)